MQALAGSFEESDLPRFSTVGNIEDFETGIGFFSGFVTLVVDQHDIAVDAHFVGMNPLGHLELRDELWVLGITHVDDRGTFRGFDVADISIAILDDDGAAAGKIHSSDLFDVLACSNRDGSIGCHAFLL
jgi:hypothetical protein